MTDTGGAGTPRGWRRAMAVVLAAFVVSRIAAVAAGVRFDTTWLERSWQIADPQLLAADPFATSWSLHTQPPLYNLGLGVVLRWSPIAPETTFHLTHLALGVALCVAMVDLARTLGARPVTATVAALVVTVSPAAIVYESWLFYTYPVAVLLTVTVALFGRWVTTGRAVWFVAMAAVATATVLTRSLYHPIWLAALLVLAWSARHPPSARRWAGAAALCAMVLVGAVVVRNIVVAGEPSTSSWFWMNASRMSVGQLSPEHRQRLIDTGELTPVAGVGSFQHYADYEPGMPPCEPEHADDPVLAEPTKSSGHVNFAYECFLPVYDAARHDTLVALRADPASAVRAQLAAWHLSAVPAQDYVLVRDNRDALGPFERVHRTAVGLVVPAPALVPLHDDVFGTYAGDVPISLTAVATTIAAVWAGAQGLRDWRRHGATAPRATAAAVAMVVVWTLVIGNTFEIGENMRFRWLVEPMAVASAAVVAQRAIDARRSRADAAEVSQG